MHINRKWRIAIIAAVIITIAAAGYYYFFWVGTPVGEFEPVNRGLVFPAIEHTLALPDYSNPVKDDLVKRSLVVYTESGGSIKVQEIEKLVDEGFYVIDKDNYLQFGPAYIAPPYFPVQKEPAQTMMAALLPGELVLDNGYLRVSGNLIIWYYGYSLKIDGKDIWILDEKGKQLFRVGDTVSIGGGQIPFSSVEEIIGQQLPPDCKGPYWLAANIVE